MNTIVCDWMIHYIKSYVAQNNLGDRILQHPRKKKSKKVMSQNKTVAARPETYGLLLQLQGLIQGQSDERIHISDALHVAVQYYHKNFKKITRTDQIELPLKK